MGGIYEVQVFKAVRRHTVCTHIHVHTLFQFSKLINVIISLPQNDMYFACYPVQRAVQVIILIACTALLIHQYSTVFWSSLLLYLLPVIIKMNKEHDTQERICSR